MKEILATVAAMLIVALGGAHLLHRYKYNGNRRAKPIYAGSHRFEFGARYRELCWAPSIGRTLMVRVR